jgi:hypothetical protein
MIRIDNRCHWVLAATALCLYGCSGGGGGGDGGGDGGSGTAVGAGSNSGTGLDTTSLSVSLIDAPVDDVKEVNVQIAAMWLKPSEGPAFELPLEGAPITVDLLSLTEDNAAVLIDNAAIEAGSYEWLAMDINGQIDNLFDSFVVTDTEAMMEIEIFVPSGRLRLVDGFEAEANQALQLVFDWDMRKGLVNPPGLGGYILKPAFRIIDMTAYGSLHGSIPVITVTAEDNACNVDNDVEDFDVGNAVYIFEGLDSEIDDLDGNEPEPLATVDALLNIDRTDYEYRTLLPYGDYTVAFTCQAANDLAESDELGNEDPADDSVAFFEPAVNVTIGPDPEDVDVEVNF